MRKRRLVTTKVEGGQRMENLQRRRKLSRSGTEADMAAHNQDLTIDSRASSRTSLEVLPDISRVSHGQQEKKKQPPSAPPFSELEQNIQLSNSLLRTLNYAPSIFSDAPPSAHGDFDAGLNIIRPQGFPHQPRNVLFSEHSITQNLNKLVAPILNPELVSILPPAVKQQDLNLFRHQQEITVALSAMTKTKMPLTSSTQMANTKPVDDACIFLCDVFYNETLMRRTLILNTVNEETKMAICDTIPDKYLFGEKLADKLWLAEYKKLWMLPVDVGRHVMLNVANNAGYVGYVNQINPYQVNQYQINPYQVNPYQVNPNQVNPYQVNPYPVNTYQVSPYQVNPYQINPLQVNPLQVNPLQVNPYQINPYQISPYQKLTMNAPQELLASTCPPAAAKAPSSNIHIMPLNTIPPTVPIYKIQEPQNSRRLMHFSQQWEVITQNSVAASWLRGYKIPFRCPPPPKFTTNVVRTPNTIQDFNACLRKLLQIGAISICDHEENEYISNALFIPRSDGENQFILNLKFLNQYIVKANFKFNDYSAIIGWIKQNCFMSIIDLKDAYYLIPVHEDHTKYLKFKINNILYKFNCLIGGLATARYVLTTLINLVMSRTRLYNQTVMIDDNLLVYGKSYEDCNNNVSYIRKTLEELGFIINNTNILTPSTRIKISGFIFNSVNMSVSLPDKKKQRIYNLLKNVLKVKTCILREFISLTGVLTAASPAVNYSWLYTKRLKLFIKLCLVNNRSHQRTISLPEFIYEDLKWWLAHVCADYGNLKFDEHSLEICSDASLTGWGAFCVMGEAFGHWKSNEGHSDNINVLELKAAFLGLKAFAKHSYNTTIILKIDNTNAISCINQMGCEKFSYLDDISREMWQWCEKRKLFIHALHIASKKNVVADALSRMMFQDPEYELTDFAFREITKMFGMPKIDIFARQCNAKCQDFVSRNWEPMACAVDAFTICWTNLNFYAFPPFFLIKDMLKKIVSDKAEGIVVVPDWPKEKWFPLFNKLKFTDCLIFESDSESGSTPIRNHHNLNRPVRLIAAKLSAKYLRGG